MQIKRSLKSILLRKPVTLFGLCLFLSTALFAVVIFSNSQQSKNALAAPLDCITNPTVAACQTNTGETVLDVVAKTNYADGVYNMQLQNGTVIQFQITTFSNDVTYAANPTLCNTTADTQMCILKYKGNLTVNSGVTVTPQARKKGFVVYVAGTLINNGTISMTARGAITAGQSVQLFKNTNGTFETVPAVGGAGGAKADVTITTRTHWSGQNAVGGIAGSNRSTGGGGAGGYSSTNCGNCNPVMRNGAGAAGTSFSGGSGGGGAGGGNTGSGTPGNGAVNGGAGGNSSVGTGSYLSSGGGGAGNNGGTVASATYKGTVGSNGTGGLLILYANYINNTGSIQANGSNGGTGVVGSASVYHASGGGGSSGGGSVNVFYNGSYTNTGTVAAAGGAAMISGWGSAYRSGAGGTGTTTVTQIASNDMRLATLTVNKGQLSPAFNPNTYNYSVTLPSVDDTDISFFGITMDSNATVTGLGTQAVVGGDNVFKIVVTDPDYGFINAYTVTVTRPLSTVSKPINIALTGLTPSLCALDVDYCDQEPDFSPDWPMYSLEVPNRITSIGFDLTKAHPGQAVQLEVNGNPVAGTTAPLQVGDNTIKVTVVAESRVDYTTYIYTIHRDLAMNPNLAKLSVQNAVQDITFDPDTTEYFVDITSDQTSLDLDIATEESDSSYTVLGNSNLMTGLNDVIIKVTAAKGTEKLYIIHVNREADGNNYLSNLTVSNGGTTYALSPVFNKAIRSYTVNVPGDLATATIDGTLDAGTSSVTGLGDKTLIAGNNRFPIVVTAENGLIGTYEVNIVKPKNGNANLAMLSAAEGSLSPTFTSGVTDYTMTVDASVTSLNLAVTPEATTSIYNVTGNKNFALGVSNLVTVTVLAENGNVQTYRIRVTRAVASNNYLSDIVLSTGELDPTFDRSTQAYEVTVPAGVTSINVTGVKEDASSYVFGNGTYYLDTGNNSVSIQVVSGTGDVRTYQLNVIRAASSNVNLIGIYPSIGTLTPNFSNSVNTYTVDLANGTTSIDFAAIKEDPKATVVGATTYSNLATGTTPVTITVTAQDGVTTNTFLINVVRDKSHDVNLKSLFVHEGVVHPEGSSDASFDPLIINYDVIIPYEYTALTIDAVPEYPDATYQILGNSGFAVGENTVIVRVTSEAGTDYTKDYTIKVTRQPQEATSSYLSALDVSAGTLAPAFDASKSIYDVTVPNDTDSITITATAADSAATITGIGSQSLSIGMNIFPVVVTNQDGQIRTYQIRVFRERTDEARLKTLTINNGTLNQTFSPDTFAYTVDTNDTSLDLSAVTMDDSATYTVTGNSGFVYGDDANNTVTITVTAADGTTTAEYTITVNKIASANNNLASLVITPGTLYPTFNKAVTLYNVSVPNDVNSMMITATAEDANAIVDGTGLQQLNVGLNTITITVTSESGSAKSYVLLVTRAQSDNNLLRELSVSNGDLSPTFNKTTNDYTVTVPYDVSTVNISGVLDDTAASAFGFGQYNLNVGSNGPIQIFVLSANGQLNVYTVNITRQELNSAQLTQLGAPEAVFDFSPQVYDYTFDVSNEVTNLSLNIETLDPDATYIVSGNSDFVVGMNTVTIDVTASDGTTTATYTLNVNRQLSANNYLSYIDLSDGTLSPDFTKTAVNYSVTVPNSTNLITVSGEAESTTSTVTGMGTKVLAVGNNVVDIVVTSSTGISRTYRLNVERQKNADNLLNSLIVRNTNDSNIQQLLPTFNSATNTYNVMGEQSQQSVELIAIPANPGSVVTGAGVRSVAAGLNVYEITVTAEDGSVNIYTVNFTRPKSSDAALSGLTSSVGTLSPAFDPATHDYVINLDGSAPMITFDAIVGDNDATVIGAGTKILTTGENTFVIAVTAEDGTVQEYTITVNQNRADEARLASLDVAGHNLTPTFNSDVYSYNITVPFTATTFDASDVTAIAIDPNATIIKGASITLNDGNNPYTIMVIAPDTFTVQTYTINVNKIALATTITSSVYSIQHGDIDFVTGMEPFTKLSDFIDEFDNPAEYLKVYDHDDNLITNPDTYVGTGMLIKLEAASTVYDQLYIVLKGDVDGNGIVDVDDVSEFANHIGSYVPLSGPYAQAVHLTNDDIIDVDDYIMLSDYVGKYIGSLN
ncbi:cadherin-like beta sandwich domain-containing protein [Candidatus Saccharibacteria bacterium]|nr:cadherin-like beta sandwich domain-containing protein [Candidatus Saccharibacteria bacterium]